MAALPDVELLTLLETARELFFQEPDYMNDDDDHEIVLYYATNMATQRQLTPRLNGFVEVILPHLNDNEFKSHFRMLPSTFDFVLGLLHDELVRPMPGNKITPQKQVLIALWRMATPDSYRSICQRFDVGKATAIRSVRQVTRALCSVSHMFIKWPTGERVQEVIDGFRYISTFPDTIGAVDGLHVNIPAPAENPDAYVNRKGHFAIQVQAVCDHKRLFTHIYAGQVGSVHDARVFRLSELQTYMNQEDKFPNNSHIIGDAAYPLHKHLLVPFSDNGHLSERQKNFNYCLSSARMAIERAFGLLRGRWRSLRRTLEMIRTETIPRYILACCVLHNICLLRNDEVDDFPDDTQGEVRIARLPADPQEQRAIAEAKRNNICANLRMRDV